ncbi:hypothetical protein A0U40_02255 [[Bacillus] sp. KCTC 13219]|nr:hypothetical protein A0U40_02255 [[Bacillus] sp. KCTC 13219]
MEEKSIFERDADFSSLVKTAKRKSLKKTILISIIVTVLIIVLLWGVLVASIYFMNKRIDTQLNELSTELYVQGANIDINAVSYDNFLVATKTSSKLYKQVGPHIINWDSRDYFYTILGAKTALQTGNAVALNGSPVYSHGQRTIAFHMPTEPTDKNDFDYIADLPGYYNIEVAVSFKEQLPLLDMWEQFPTAQWAWLIDEGLYDEMEEAKKELEKLPDNAMFPMDISEVNDTRAYGFPILHHKTITNNPIESAEAYIAQLNYRDGYPVDVVRGIIGKEAPKDWLIAGVVLTGKQEELLPYLQQNNVHTVRIGVVIPY